MRLSRALFAARRPASSASSVVASRGLSVAAGRLAPQRRGCAGAAAGEQQTQLARYLQASGAVWASAVEVRDVAPAADGRSVAWRVDVPPERLAALRPGDFVESRPFPLGGAAEEEGRPEVQARFQFYAKGDADCKTEGMCSLWLTTDSQTHVPLRLRVGSVEHAGGASEFCTLADVLTPEGAVEISLTLPEESSEVPAVPLVQQSLQLTGLQLAEWKLHNVKELFKAGELVSSPPFRFHHVLLGDMYLELLPGHPFPEHCTLFFRCRVPSMKLRVGLEVGQHFARSFEAIGRSEVEKDLKEARCLQVNLEAPGVLGEDGSLTVRCSLEEVVAIPASVRDMIPRLDERASWPKRL